MMYTTNSATTTFADSKYTVADILSSMANGGAPLTPTSFSDPAPNPYVSSISGTGTTPTLTPTTLASIERTFLELGAAASNSIPQDLSRQSGFVPPVVNPVLSNGAMKPEYDYYYDGSDDMSRDSSDTDPSDWKSDHGGKKARMDHGAHGGMPTTLNMMPTSNRGGARRRRLKDDQLPPEEAEKRRVRRERNKLAAAKCRQRRVDHTNVLINQTEALEEEKSGLEDEIQSLQQQKEQLEFLLEAHKPLCSAKVDCVIHIKPEDQEGAPCSSAPSAICSSTPSSRPTSLAIGSRAHAASGASSAAPATSIAFGSSTAATGVPISTPSNGVFTIGLHSLADGHTSLTPITGVPSCGADTHRSARDNSPNEGTVTSPTTLMAL